MPAASVFVDTNLLFYIRDVRDPAKSARAIEWLRALGRTEQGRSNLQVMTELTNVLVKRRPDLTAAEIFALVDDVAFLGTGPVTPRIVTLSRVLHTRCRYAWWDCLLLASAIELGCTHFLSEDMQDGQTIAAPAHGLTIIDPFAHSPEQILTQ